MGNTDKSADKFYFTTITSASVEGVVKTNATVNGFSNVTLDPTLHPDNTTTDIKGRFQFEGVGEGNHTIYAYSKDTKPYKENIFVPAGVESLEPDLVLDILTMHR